MQKKSILIIVAIIVIILIGSFILVNNSNRFEVNGINFKIPNTYKVIDNYDEFNLTNGSDSIQISKNTTSNINKTVENYIKSKENLNDSVKCSNLNINDLKVYKVTLNNNTAISHYWFEKNDKVCHLYTWSNNPNTDLVVYDLIRSTESFILL